MPVFCLSLPLLNILQPKDILPALFVYVRAGVTDTRPITLLSAKSPRPSDEMISPRGSYLACVYCSSVPWLPASVLTRTKIYVFVPCMICILAFFCSYTRPRSCVFFFRRSTGAPGSILENRNPSIIVHFLDSNLYEQGQSTLLSHELRFCSSTLSELTIATALSGRLEALRRGKDKKKMYTLRVNCK